MPKKITNNERNAGRKSTGRLQVSLTLALTPKAMELLRSKPSMAGWLSTMIEKETTLNDEIPA